MKIRPTTLLIAAAFLLPGTITRGDDLDQSQYTELRELLSPDSAELWRTIPWKISVLDARQAAAREGKPIFIWAMDGHPLGCT